MSMVKASNTRSVPSHMCALGRRSSTGAKTSAYLVRTAEFAPSAATTRSYSRPSASTSGPSVRKVNRTPSSAQRSCSSWSRTLRLIAAKPWPPIVVRVPRKWTSTSSHRANRSAMRAYTTGSACSMPPRVSSLRTTPKPNVSSGALRSQTSTSASARSAFASAAKYRPPGPPPMTAIRMGSARRHGCAQAETLQLAGRRPRQRGDELDRARVLVGRDEPLGELLQFGDLHVVADDSVAQDDGGVHDLPPLGVRPADHRALHDVGVLVERLLHLGRTDVVARGDDHVVAAGLVPEVAVDVADVGVAGDVPAVLHVDALARVGEVAAAGGTLDREPARRAVRHRLARGVEDGRAVAGDRLSGGSGPDLVVGGGDEHVQHLGASDAVDEPDAGRGGELFPHGPGQVLAGRDGAAQRAQAAFLAGAQHH